MDKQTAIRVMRMLEMTDKYEEELHRLTREGVIGPGTRWLEDACRIAAECIEESIRLEDDGK